MKRPLALTLALSALLTLGEIAPQPSIAGSIAQATPHYALTSTLLLIPFGSMSAVEGIRNTDLQAERFEIHTYAWSQQDGTNKKVETRDIPIVYPRLPIVEAGQEVPVRLGITNAPTTKEEAYRILVQNLPGDIPDNGSMFHFITSYEIPLFVEPQQPHPDTAITSITGGYQTVTLHLHNRGNAHSLIKTVDITFNGKTQTRALLGYVLADSTVNVNTSFEGCGKGAMRVTPDAASGVPSAEFNVTIPCKASVRH